MNLLLNLGEREGATNQDVLDATALVMCKYLGDYLSPPRIDVIMDYVMVYVGRMRSTPGLVDIEKKAITAMADSGSEFTLLDLCGLTVYGITKKYPLDVAAAAVKYVFDMIRDMLGKERGKEQREGE